MIRPLGLAAIAVAVLGAPAGARAAFLQYAARLDGPSESPANASPGTGFALVDIDTDALTMRVRVTFQDLIGTTTASHIHSATAAPGAGTAGVATTTPTFPGFPLGVTSGSYDQTFNMTLASSYNPTFVTTNGGTVASARAALFAGIADGKAYLNVHTTFAPGGEIRGFLRPVPGPSGVLLLGVGGVGLLAAARRGRAARTTG